MENDAEVPVTNREEMEVEISVNNSAENDETVVDEIFDQIMKKMCPVNNKNLIETLP